MCGSLKDILHYEKGGVGGKGIKRKRREEKRRKKRDTGMQSLHVSKKTKTKTGRYDNPNHRRRTGQKNEYVNNKSLLLLLLLLMIWQSPGLPGWRKVNFITVTRRPHHPNIAAGLYCLATSPGFLPTHCEKWSGFFYVHWVFLSYTLDRRLKVSSERLVQWG